MAFFACFPIPFLREVGHGIVVWGMGGQCFVFCGPSGWRASVRPVAVVRKLRLDFYLRFRILEAEFFRFIRDDGLELRECALADEVEC